MARQVNLVRSKVRQRMLTRLAESSGRPLECHGNVSPREMAVEGAKNPGTEPGVQVGPFALNSVTRSGSSLLRRRLLLRDLLEESTRRILRHVVSVLGRFRDEGRGSVIGGLRVLRIDTEHTKCVVSLLGGRLVPEALHRISLRPGRWIGGRL